MPKLTRAAAAEMFARLAEGAPEPKTELNYTNPYTLLVAVALSAQATDVGVNRATAKLFTIADTPAKMLRLGEEKLGEHVRTIGLWRNKAKNIIALSKILIEHYDGEVPRERETLETLPGVGRKTANVVCNVAFNQPTIAVDTHIFRVSNRTGLAPGKTPLEVEKGLLKITPDDFRQHAHHWLILHGRYVCKARTLDCPACTISDICLYKDKSGEEAKPAAKKKTTKIKAKKTGKKPARKMAGAPKLRTSRPNNVKPKKKTTGATGQAAKGKNTQ
ncbi:MAG: endonuclease III [Parvularculaceae bacterium]